MSNVVYPKYKGAILAAGTNTSLDQNTSNDGPYCVLIDEGTYTYSASHQFYSDLSGVVGSGVRITTPSVASATGLFSGDNITFTAVTGSSVEALVIYRHNSGANSTWRLVLILDTAVTGLPVTPNGGDITVTWSGSGILQISDARVKQNIRKVDDVKPGFGPLSVYEYNYVGELKRRRGFIAQEVAQHLPEAVVPVHGNEWGDLMAVDYDRVFERLAA